MESSTWFDFCVHIFFTHKFNLTNWLFWPYTQESLFFSKFQVFDEARLGGAAGKGTHRSLHDEGCFTSCIGGVPGFCEFCITSFLSPNSFCSSDGAQSGCSKPYIEARGQSAFHSSNSHVSPLGPTTGWTKSNDRVFVFCLCSNAVEWTWPGKSPM